MSWIVNDASYEIFQSIVEHNPDTIFILSVKGIITKANQVATNLLGYSEEEMVGQHYTKILKAEEDVQMDEHFSELLKGTSYEKEMKGIQQDRKLVNLQVKFIPLTVGDIVVGIFCVAKDLTELLSTKTTLSRVEDQLKSLYESVADSIGIIDLTGRMIDVNPAFEQMYQLKKEEVINKRFSELLIIPKDRLSQAVHFINKLKSGEDIVGFETKRYLKDGTTIDVSLTLSPVRDQLGEIRAISSIARNITKQKQLQRSLIESEDRYRKLVELSPKGIIVQRKGMILYANPYATVILKEIDLVGKRFLSYIHPKDRNLYKERVSKEKIGRELPFTEIKMLCKDENIIDVEVVGMSIFYDGHPAILTILSDVTKRKTAEKALIESEKGYRLLTENSLDIIQQVDLDGIVTYASPSHKNILGYDMVEYVGKWVFFQPDGQLDEQFKETFFNMALTQKPFVCEIVRKHKAGFEVWLEVKGTPMFDDTGTFKYMMLIGHEVTERKKHQKHLEYLGLYDPLTGIPNRRLFESRLDLRVREAKRHEEIFAVMYLDMDHFKEINDTFGHDTGDDLLRQFSNRIRGQLHPSDTLARQGGDEFTILIPNIQSEEDALLIAERIMSSLQDSWQIGKHIFNITSSIGIALFPKDGITRQELIKHADMALYDAKRNGRNRYKIYGTNVVNYPLS